MTNLLSLSRVVINNLEDDNILKCSVRIQNLKFVYDQSTFLCISYLNELETLRIHFTVTLENIDLEIGIFPLTIKKTLESAGLPWDVMSIIGRLPNLQVLIIVKDAFVGEEWETGGWRISEVHVLKSSYDFQSKEIDNLANISRNLSAWCCNRAMSCKVFLGIWVDIPTLHTIEVNSYGYPVSKSSVQIEEEQHENGNEDLGKAFHFIETFRGSINASGLVRRLIKLGQAISHEEVENMRRQADINGDGKLNQFEFNKFMMAVHVPQPNDLKCSIDGHQSRGLM